MEQAWNISLYILKHSHSWKCLLKSLCISASVKGYRTESALFCRHPITNDNDLYITFLIFTHNKGWKTQTLLPVYYLVYSLFSERDHLPVTLRLAEEHMETIAASRSISDRQKKDPDGSPLHLRGELWLVSPGDARFQQVTSASRVMLCRNWFRPRQLSKHKGVSL